MTDEQPGREERRERKDTISDGIRQGIGILSAFKDALEETINEARERGDLSADRAREIMRDAMSRAQEVAGEARERMDWVPRREFDALRDRVEELKVRLTHLERRETGPGGPAAGETAGGGPDEGGSGPAEA